MTLEYNARHEEREKQKAVAGRVCLGDGFPIHSLLLFSLFSPPLSWLYPFGLIF